MTDSGLNFNYVESRRQLWFPVPPFSPLPHHHSSQIPYVRASDPCMITASSRQRHEHIQQLAIVRRAQTRHRIPPAYRSESRRPTPLITPTRDIIQCRRVGIQCWIDESHRALPSIRALFVDQGDDTTHRRRRGRCPINQRDFVVHGDDVIGAVSGDVRVSAHSLRVVVLLGSVRGFVVRVVRLHGRGLVGRLRKHVAEPAAGVDDGLAGLLGSGHAGTGDDLRGAYGCHVWAGSWEGGVEGAGAAVVESAPGAFGFRAALPSIARDAVVAGGI